MTDDQIRAEFAKLGKTLTEVGIGVDRCRTSVETLATGLTLMVETLATHTSMLKALMVAAAPPDDASPLQEVLQRLALAVEQNGGALERLTSAMKHGRAAP